MYERKNILTSGILFFLTIFPSCNSEVLPECLQTPGKIVEKQIPLETFNGIAVYGKVKLSIKQGPNQKVVVEAGENLIREFSAVVSEGELSIRNLNTCDFFRTTYVPVVHVTVPNLLSIVNASNQKIEGDGVLNFPSISLISSSKIPATDLYSNGDFELKLNSEKIFISGDDFSNFYISGKTNYLKASFWAGDGRLDSRDLIADSIIIFHRGTNKMFLNPQQSLKGEIRSTGNVFSLNRPPVVEVQSFYTGKLYFQ